MDWEIEQRNLRLEDMIIVYEQEIKTLQTENEKLKRKLQILEAKLSVIETYDEDDDFDEA
tara:strand:+ start:777 stop:956 length:180 start_codon:yes stop_codon:yes gene_type:complete